MTPDNQELQFKSKFDFALDEPPIVQHSQSSFNSRAARRSQPECDISPYNHKYNKN